MLGKPRSIAGNKVIKVLEEKIKEKVQLEDDMEIHMTSLLARPVQAIPPYNKFHQNIPSLH